MGHKTTFHSEIIFEALYITDRNVNNKKEIKVNLTLNKDSN